MRNDSMARFHNALYLGDAAERVKVSESERTTAAARGGGLGWGGLVVWAGVTYSEGWGE